jgi:hypothetical protein
METAKRLSHCPLEGDLDPADDKIGERKQVDTISSCLRGCIYRERYICCIRIHLLVNKPTVSSIRSFFFLSPISYLCLRINIPSFCVSFLYRIEMYTTHSICLYSDFGSFPLVTFPNPLSQLVHDLLYVVSGSPFIILPTTSERRDVSVSAIFGDQSVIDNKVSYSMILGR